MGKCNLSKRDLKRLYVTQGKTGQQIAAEYGVSTATIYRVMEEFQIPRRPRTPNMAVVFGAIPKKYWDGAKRNAGNRGLTFDISPSYMWRIFVRQRGRCPLTGLFLEFSCRGGLKGTTASLDRIDSNKGYVKGNVRWVHKTVNRMRNTMTDEEFKSWCAKVVIHACAD